MSSSAALDAKQTITNYLKHKWYFLTYKYSIQPNERRPELRQQVTVLFSKPTKEMPCPEAMAQFTFFLDDALRNVVAFTIETDPHKHILGELEFDLEKMIDQVIKRKMSLKKQSLVNLNDDFTNTRIPNSIAAAKQKERQQAKEKLEDQLLDLFARKDQENQGKITYAQAKQALYSSDVPLTTKDRTILLAFLDMEARDEFVEYGAIVSSIADAIDTIQYASTKEEDTATVAQVNTKELEYTQYTFDQLVSSTTASLLAESSTSTTSSSPIELTRRQLRDILESPLMVLSKNEINLLLALAFPSEAADQTFPSARFEFLLQEVKALRSQFQKKLIWQHPENHMVSYISKRFQLVERGTLRGSAQYLRHQIPFFELKQVLIDLRLLFLTPYQIIDLLVLSQQVLKGQNDEGILPYDKFIPLLVQYVQDASSISSSTQVSSSSATATQKLSSEWIEEIKAQLLSRFCAYDPEKKGTLSPEAFEESLSLVPKEERLVVFDEKQILYLRTVATNTLTSSSSASKHRPIQYGAFTSLAIPYVYYLLQQD